jgi:hypothetical protein
MNVPLQIKQFTFHTTQITLSTSFLASALTGCAAAGLDPEGETEETDAGDHNAVVEPVHMTEAEQASHAYNAPPVGDQVVVFSAQLEDSPTTPPPATAVAKTAQTAPRDRVVRKEKVAQTRGRNADPSDCDVPDTDDCEVAYQVSVDTVTRASATPTAGTTERARPKKSAITRDPIGESFVPPPVQSLQPSLGGF